jgi:hypothetical protein
MANEGEGGGGVLYPVPQFQFVRKHVGKSKIQMPTLGECVPMDLRTPQLHADVRHVRLT